MAEEERDAGGEQQKVSVWRGCKEEGIKEEGGERMRINNLRTHKMRCMVCKERRVWRERVNR